MQQWGRSHTYMGSKSDLLCVWVLLEAVFLVAKISEDFVPCSVGDGIVQVSSLSPLAFSSLPTKFLQLSDC